MYGSDGFAVSHYTLLWEGQEVGGIGFGDLVVGGGGGDDDDDDDDAAATTTRLAAEDANANATTEAEQEEKEEDDDPTSMEKKKKKRTNDDTGTVISSVNNNETTIISPLHPPKNDLTSRLSLTFTPHTPLRHIPTPHIRISIIWTLALAAIPPSSERILHLWSPVDQESPCKFTISATRRDSPPWLQYFWVVEAVVRAGEWVVENQVERGFRGVLRVDGVVVGKGLWFWRDEDKKDT
ncbi:MAG: hypothetical protein Q9169_008061 [Polycauliona sp. 2 TL-2023]